MNFTNFWRIENPIIDYYKSIFINGLIEYQYSVPGVECLDCNDAWAGSRVLDVQCPVKMKDRVEMNQRWPITVKKHKKLCEELKAELKHSNFTGE